MPICFGLRTYVDAQWLLTDCIVSFLAYVILCSPVESAMHTICLHATTYQNFLIEKYNRLPPEYTMISAIPSRGDEIHLLDDARRHERREGYFSASFQSSTAPAWPSILLRSEREWIIRSAARFGRGNIARISHQMASFLDRITSPTHLPVATHDGYTHYPQGKIELGLFFASPSVRTRTRVHQMYPFLPLPLCFFLYITFFVTPFCLPRFSVLFICFVPDSHDTFILHLRYPMPYIPTPSIHTYILAYPYMFIVD